MIVIRPAIFPAGVTAGVSTRQGGVSPAPLGMNTSFHVGDEPRKVIENRELFLSSLGVSLLQLALPGQVHGARIQEAAKGGDYPETDGLITRTKDIVLGVSIADCVPVLLFDPVQKAIAAVHSGWRGTAANVVHHAIGSMISVFSSASRDLLAYIGPSASACCYAVGSEVARLFPGDFTRIADGNTFLDLKGVVRTQMVAEGVLPERIETSPHGTISEPAMFHSFRREGEKAGRMLAVIALTA